MYTRLIGGIGFSFHPVNFVATPQEGNFFKAVYLITTAASRLQEGNFSFFFPPRLPVGSHPSRGEFFSGCLF